MPCKIGETRFTVYTPPGRCKVACIYRYQICLPYTLFVDEHPYLYLYIYSNDISTLFSVVLSEKKPDPATCHRVGCSNIKPTHVIKLTQTVHSPYKHTLQSSPPFVSWHQWRSETDAYSVSRLHGLRTGLRPDMVHPYPGMAEPGPIFPLSEYAGVFPLERSTMCWV